MGHSTYIRVIIITLPPIPSYIPGVHDTKDFKDDELKHGAGEREGDRKHQLHHIVMDLHTHTQAHTHTRTHTHAQTHTCTHTHSQATTSTHTAHTHTHTCTHITH